MKISEFKQILRDGGLAYYSHLYADVPGQTGRFIAALDRFAAKYGADRDVRIFSVPGRSELSGNHTDHNRGCVLAGAIDRDIIAVASAREDNVIRFSSEGYPEDVVRLAEVADPDAFGKYTSSALIAGMAQGFVNSGYNIGGFDAYSTTEVLKGSGISSSAAFEVMSGNILNHLYNEGSIENAEIATLAQYAENVYFGKPCGLMDQMACAVGGFVYMDFEDPEDPVVEPIPFSLTDAGYSLCIVNTGGNHADLNADYASVPAEMKSVAQCFGRDVLRGITEEELVARAGELRQTVGDRALLRAFHFIRENGRVEAQRIALKRGDAAGFFSGVLASGRSSFEYLQNVYTNLNPSEQGLSLALCVTEGFLGGRGGAWRVHGGGFAGTIQAFVRHELAEEYSQRMNRVFGAGAAMRLKIRPAGALEILFDCPYKRIVRRIY